MKKIVTGLFTVISLVVLSACGSDILEGDSGEALDKNSNGPLAGDYAGPHGERWQRFGGNTTIMRFEGDKVIQVEEGEEFNLGTYEIDDDELVFTLDGNTLRADLLTENQLDDREYFTVTSADGLLGMLSGVTFRKLTEEEKEYIENYENLEDQKEAETDESPTINGDYTGTFGLQYEESLRTIRFEGNTVTAILDDSKTISGTYEIDGDELIIAIDGFNIRADLSDDREYFTVTSADGLLEVITGITFTNKNE